MKLEFTKMQGLGNDFILLNDPDARLRLEPEAIRFLCDRHFGVGADGVIIVSPSERADLKMKIFNSDGSEAEMCGNGIRCFALYARDRGLSSGTEMAVETGAGIIRPRIERDQVAVDMGEPVFDAEKIPVNLPGEVVDYPVVFAGRKVEITCVSMGNPHCVIFLPPGEEPPVTELGPVIETDPLFPAKINVEFIRVRNPGEIDFAVWERGAGITLACGTGACAAVVAAARTGRTGREVLVHLPGGDLKIEWKENNHVFMTGPAVEVFRGKITI
ncbi:MAG: diaminopimelate epimerase [Candidatus Erginobacter occultus]|nr:diaminopimelate epimerase [Candidatus Erginobacter occultus]